MQEDSLAERLRSFMQERQLSQKSVAEAANISQSTVSRALQGHFERQGRAKSKLFTYMHNELLSEGLSGKGKDKVVRAFESIWDGSEEHAVGIAKIIKASGGLLPPKRPGGDR
jgi:transcriptional regulator with XRE-family HTH domain